MLSAHPEKGDDSLVNVSHTFVPPVDSATGTAATGQMTARNVTSPETGDESLVRISHTFVPPVESALGTAAKDQMTARNATCPETGGDSLVRISHTFVPSVDNSLGTAAMDQVTAFIHIRLRQEVPNAEESFEKWCTGILRASQVWKPGAWAGRIVLKTPASVAARTGKTEYVILFRFRSYALMHGWLNSDERLKWKARLAKLGCTDQISTDLHEGIVAFMPRSMQEVAWRCVAALDDVQNGEKGAGPLLAPERINPPPKWKTGLVVWIGLQLSVLPWDLLVAPSLELPLFWSLALSLFCTVPVVKYLLLPLLDRCLHRFLFGRRCPAVEPCLSLQEGCPCCRARSGRAEDDGAGHSSDDDDDNRLAMLEQRFRNLRRAQNVMRGRLLERLEHLESFVRKEEQSIALNIDESRRDFVMHEVDTLLAATGRRHGLRQVELTQIQNAGGGSGKADKSSNRLGEDDAVTVCIAYQVRRECFLQFEEWVQEMARTAAMKSVGHRGAVVIQAPVSAAPSTATHVVVFQYDSEENLQAWSRLPLRKQMVARLQPLLVPSTLTRLQIVVYDSLSDMTGFTSLPSSRRRAPSLTSSSSSASAAATASATSPSAVIGREAEVGSLRHDPQAWKISLVIGFALFLEIWFFGVPVVGPWVKSWGVGDPVVAQVTQTMVGTFIGVAIVDYILMPVLVPLSGNWLNSPWRESRWSCCRVLQRGFYCWDTVGAKLRKR